MIRFADAGTRVVHPWVMGMHMSVIDSVAVPMEVSVVDTTTMAVAVQELEHSLSRETSEGHVGGLVSEDPY